MDAIQKSGHEGPARQGRAGHRRRRRHRSRDRSAARLGGHEGRRRRLGRRGRRPGRCRAGGRAGDRGRRQLGGRRDALRGRRGRPLRPHRRGAAQRRHRRRHGPARHVDDGELRPRLRRQRPRLLPVAAGGAAADARPGRRRRDRGDRLGAVADGRADVRDVHRDQARPAGARAVGGARGGARRHPGQRPLPGLRRHAPDAARRGRHRRRARGRAVGHGVRDPARALRPARTRWRRWRPGCSATRRRTRPGATSRSTPG